MALAEASDLPGVLRHLEAAGLDSVADAAAVSTCARDVAARLGALLQATPDECSQAGDASVAVTVPASAARALGVLDVRAHRFCVPRSCSGRALQWVAVPQLLSAQSASQWLPLEWTDEAWAAWTGHGESSRSQLHFK